MSDMSQVMPTYHRGLLGVGFVLLLLLLWGCSEQGDKAAQGTSEKSGRIFATVGEAPLYEDELQQYLKLRPPGFNSKSESETVSGRVDELITAELLHQEAISQGLEKEPGIRHLIRQMLAQEILEQEVTNKVLAREISDEELRGYYDAHIDEFSRPEQVRIADIFFAFKEGSSEEEKQSLREKAEDVLQEALQDQGKRFGFTRLIATYSDKHDKYPLGQTGFFDSTGKPLGLDKTLVEASFSLKQNGEIADRVVATPEGFHIIMLVGKRAAWQRNFSDVKHEIEGRMRREEIEKKRNAFISSLKNKWKVAVKDDVVGEIGRAYTQQGDTEEKPGPPSTTVGMSPPPFPGEK